MSHTHFPPSNTFHHRVRSFFAIDEREPVVAYCQTAVGKIALCVAAGLALQLVTLVVQPDHRWWQVVAIILAAAGMAYLPKHRSAILFAGTTFHSVTSLPPTVNAHVALATFMIFAWGTLVLVRRNKSHVYARRPVIALIFVIVGMFLISRLLPTGLLRSGVLALMWLINTYIWFIAYAIVDQRSRHVSSDMFQLGTMQPFWGATTTPFGKGAAFLRKTLSHTPRDLAITQIKGIKLLVWANILLGLKLFLLWLTAEMLNLPPVEQAMTAYLRAEPYPILIGWAGIIAETVDFTLWLAVCGHAIVGTARLAGFRLPRNMCRPLEARTLAEFWNCYNFYFKELMVDFFYIPTFLKTFRKHPRLRMFFSTFMAAGIGNFLYHFLQGIFLFEEIGFQSALDRFHASYLFYCTVLAVAIGISQLRANAGYEPSATLVGRIKSFVVVWGFVLCLQVFASEGWTFSLGDRLSYMISLFGISI